LIFLLQGGEDDLLRKISQTLKQEVAPYRVWETEKVNGMEEQNDSNNCGVFVTAWAENALITGKVNNCIKRGHETEYRRKIYTALKEPDSSIQNETAREKKVSSQELKMIKQTGHLNTNIMNEYIRKIVPEGMEAIIHNSLIIKIDDEECKVGNHYDTEKRIGNTHYMPIMIQENSSKNNRWMLVEVNKIKNKNRMVIYNPDNKHKDCKEEIRETVSKLLMENYNEDVWNIKQCTSVCISDKINNGGFLWQHG